ncbi:MAG: aminotransferase class I/II-fold pyridoxal phosphate-dependent enzyme [Longispora sp.]|nr:aminotransferase class I/II-fold pyridoxal phosphate-dependent enzyme [Longispora sp. (in: high G+C Gram-positive bacteria)]
MMNPLDAYTTEELRQRRSVKWSWYPKDVLPFWIAEMDTPLAEPIRDVLLGALAQSDLGYANPDGGARDAFVEFAATRYNWRPELEDVRVSPSIMTGVVEILRRVTEPGDAVVINPPVYPPFFSFVSDSGRRIVESPLARRDDGSLHIDLDRLERDFAAGAAAYLLCSPQNPTGGVYDRETLLAVSALAERYDVRVLADEVHAPLTLPGSTHIPFLSLGTKAAARAIAFHSASKAWNLAGLTCAILVGGPEARPDLNQIPEHFTDAVGHLGTLATESAFRDGTQWLDSLLAGLDANRHHLGELLKVQLPEIGYRIPEATYLAWLDCTRLNLGDDPAEIFLESGRIAVNSGLAFGTPGIGHVRFNFATSADRIAEGVRRMASTVEKIRADRGE